MYPSDVEQVISAHADIADASVIPLPESEPWEFVCAVVVPKEGSSISIRDVQRLCASQLADYQHPQRYYITNMLPRNSMGKVMKHELLDRVLSGDLAQ